MSVAKDVLDALIGLFVDDEFLAAAVLAVVGCAALLIIAGGAQPLLAGAILLVGNVGVLVLSVLGTARRRP